MIILRQVQVHHIDENMIRSFCCGSPADLERLLEQFRNLQYETQLYDSSEAEELRLFCEKIAAQAVPAQSLFEFELTNAASRLKKADLATHKHGDRALCPSCGKPGIFDTSNGGALIFEDAIWFYQGKFFCTYCAN